MGYYMDIVRCDLIRTDKGEGLDGIDDSYVEWEEVDNNGIDLIEHYFKWDDEFTNDLIKLAKVGVVGELVTSGEEGELVKYVLGNGAVEEYYGEVVFPDKPNETHTEVKSVVEVTG